MQQHISDAQHIGELLFLYAVDGLGIFLFVFCRLYFLVKGFQPTRYEAASATPTLGLMISAMKSVKARGV